MDFYTHLPFCLETFNRFSPFSDIRQFITVSYLHVALHISVDEFRAISLQLLQSHYKSSCEKGIANRIEVLPISWHDELHSESTGIDRKLKSITLESIPRLREFTNDTLLDIFFYTSPCYCQVRFFFYFLHLS